MNTSCFSWGVDTTGADVGLVWFEDGIEGLSREQSRYHT